MARNPYETEIVLASSALVIKLTKPDAREGIAAGM
jgi:hypothetical protein